MPYATQPAFRCHHCGHLAGPEHAGTEPTPTRCPVCDRDGWEVLADVKPERLAELGLSEVARHTPLTADQDAAANLERCRAAAATLVAKREHWEQHEEQIKGDYHATCDAHDKLAAQGPAGTLPKHLAAHFDEVAKLKQEAKELENLAFTDDDAFNLAELEKVIAAGGVIKRGDKPRHVRPSVIDRAKTFDRG